MEYILVFLLFYLIGSISPAFITGKLVKGIDIREVNTGNAGASNVTITLGLKWGLVVGITDILKGLIPILILRYFFPTNDILWFVGGISLVIGHVYPFYMDFKGGKGTSTFVGVLIGGAPLVGIILMIVLILVTIISDHVAIGTLFFIVLAPVSLYVIDYQLLTVIIVVLYSLLSFYKHFSNFINIYKKKETGLRAVFRD